MIITGGTLKMKYNCNDEEVIDTAQVFSAAMAGNANNSAHQKSRTMANTKMPPFLLSTIFSTTRFPVPFTLSFCTFFCFISHLLPHIFSPILFSSKQHYFLLAELFRKLFHYFQNTAISACYQRIPAVFQITPPFRLWQIPHR